MPGILNGVRYPRPRKRVPSPLTEDETLAGLLPPPLFPVSGAGPETHNWLAFLVATGGAKRSTCVSGPYQGIGLVRGIMLAKTQGGQDAGGLALLVAEDDTGTQNSGAVLTAPTGISVLDPVSTPLMTDNDIDEIRANFPELDYANVPNYFGYYHLRYAIYFPRFYLKFTARSIVGDDVGGRILVNLLTGLTAEQLALYL